MPQQQQRYRIIERIAAGGMAEVYRAESAGLEGFKKVVAIKRVLPHLAEKKQFIGMFLDEARTSAHLSHSNCVQVFDIGVGDNTYFIVMEFVDGSDLKAIIEHRRSRGQKIPIEAASLMCLKICEGLAYAHDAVDTKGKKLGIVHRDMSPPNVLITRHGEVKIADFGLAKANSQLERSEPGIIKGKFSYLSPEAAMGEAVDHRTDIFAIGIMLWEMLAGRRLFLGETDLDTVRQVQAARIPSLSQLNSEVTPELERIVQKALARDVSHRYQSARDLGRDLNTHLYRVGKAVSSFDIAGLVREAMVARDSERRHKIKDDKVSIIGTLIDQAMVEFTSLESPGTSSDGSVVAQKGSPTMGASPLNLGSFDGLEGWGKDQGAQKSAARRASLPADSFEAGNLAALEEDDDPMPPSPPRQPSSWQPPPTSSAPPQPAETSTQGAADKGGARRKGGGGSGALIAVVVVVMAAAGALGAYFGGLMH
ncbi:MAG TPA: serine/threonine-protein kinase [Polyangiaceae bacterium]|jgi:serine/threonine-protein kinase|nr:serine/threonine-protein kinase [Polyangiaceae bacterium]